MLRLADVLRRHAPAYIERHGSRMMPGHLRSVQAILRCRTPAMGGHLAACAQCGHEHLVYHSCRHRACPQCGYDTTTRWLERQRDLLLAAPYFHVVLTLPAELRRLVRPHQKALLPLLFRAAFESLAELCADRRFLGAQIGALAALHTWTRTLEWHPHVHLLVPAGGLAPDGRTLLAVPRRRQRFLVPVRALAKRFRGRFLHLARRAIPDVAFPVIPRGKSWVVFAKPTVQGADQVLEYLGRYVHKTAIADGALLACDDRNVKFRYRDSRDQRSRVMTLEADELLRRFLQHVLPKGMHRVRAFGRSIRRTAEPSAGSSSYSRSLCDPSRSRPNGGHARDVPAQVAGPPRRASASACPRRSASRSSERRSALRRTERAPHPERAPAHTSSSPVLMSTFPARATTPTASMDPSAP
jgi:hypothetical protein